MNKFLVGALIVGSGVLGYLFGYQQNELNHLSKIIHDAKMAKEKEEK